MSDEAVTKELPPKRRRMMDMILALGGLKEEQTIPPDKVDEEIAHLKSSLSPLMENILAFPDEYFTLFLKTAERINFTVEIGEKRVLEDAAETIEKAVNQSDISGLNETLRILKTAAKEKESQDETLAALTETVQQIASSLVDDPELALSQLQELGVKTRYGSPPCHVACPAGIHGQTFVNLIRDGRFEEGLEHMRSVYPFSGTLGRVCGAPCETKCQRGRIDQPVSIRNLHRFLGDIEISRGPFKVEVPKLDKDKKVAVVGAGPAGIACAYDLVKMGYPVKVFEAKSETGGLLRYGIPEYRLPRNIIDEEIGFVEKLGVEIVTGRRIDEPTKLLEEGFDAVFLATGASSSRKLRVDGEESKGVYHALEFLEEVNQGKKFNLGKRVAVIGGGNAAIDASRVSLRLGAEDVIIVYRRSKEEMPAISHEIEEAENEGVQIHILSSPVKILQEKGVVKGLTCLKMQLGEPDESGRRRPVPIPDSEFDIEVDTVIVAIGQGIDPADYFEGLEYSRWGTIAADDLTYQTSVAGIFAGGDAVSGPATVVKAVGSGKKAARAIDLYLRGEDLAKGALEKPTITASVEIEGAKVSDERRAPMPMLEIKDRQDFKEVELGFDEATARAEANRCINCAISNMGVNVYGETVDPNTLNEMMVHYVRDEAERGVILVLIRELGAMTAKTLAEKTGIAQDRVFQHLIMMKRNEVLITAGEEDGYVLYDVIRTPRPIETALQTISDLALQLAGAKKELTQVTADLKPQDMGRLTGALEVFSRARDKLATTEVDGAILANETLNKIEEQIKSALLLSYRTRAKLPSTRPKVSVDDLAEVDVPSVLEEYKSQMGYAPLLGFGTIEWHHEKCLGCKSCELSCPEDAIELKPVIRVQEFFRFSKDDLEKLPVNKAAFYESVRALAIRKPDDNIVLEKDAPGFGSIEIDLWLCVACRTCVRRCPGPDEGALDLELKWSLPEVVKQITSQSS
ncbi:MAG: FAD-dependent oxidoreductase [Candidatus Thorarchaeota archaeon]